MAGMLPIQNSNCGNGSCCAVGEKWLGARPILQDHKDNVKDGKKDCFAYKKAKQETLTKGLELGTNILKALAL